jgi:hypothetical protein
LGARRITLSPLSTSAPEREGSEGSFIDKLALELKLRNATLEALRDHQVSRGTLLALTRIELEERFNISLNDAVSLHSWSVQQLKDEEEKERNQIMDEEKKERKQLRNEEKKERERLRQKKEKNAKRVLIFNEVKERFEETCFPDQNSLQAYIFVTRARGLERVDKDAVAGGPSPVIQVIREWDRLVKGDRYALSGKVLDVDVLQREIQNAEKSEAEYGCQRRLSLELGKELRYMGSDIKMKGPDGKDLGDIDTLFMSEDGEVVVLLERKRTASAREIYSVPKSKLCCVISYC